MAEVEIQKARTLAEHSMPHCLNLMPCSTKTSHSILHIIHGPDSDNGRFSLLKNPKKPVDNRYVCNTVSQITLSIYLMTIFDACAFLISFPHYLFMPNYASY